MPLKPCATCGTLGMSNRCGGCQSAFTQAMDRYRTANRPTTTARGYGSRWQALSKRIIAAHPYCTRCNAGATLGNPLTVDHIVPKSAGGGEEEHNLRVLCRRCNSSKGARR